MSIEKRFQIKQIAGVAIAIIAAAVLLFLLFGTKITSENTYESGFLLGINSGVIVAGIAIAIWATYILADKERLRKAEIARNDERMIFIRNRAASLTSAILLIVLYAGGILFNTYGMQQQGHLLFGVAILGLAIYGIVTAILRRIH